METTSSNLKVIDLGGGKISLGGDIADYRQAVNICQADTYIVFVYLGGLKRAWLCGTTKRAERVMLQIGYIILDNKAKGAGDE